MESCTSCNRKQPEYLCSCRDQAVLLCLPCFLEHVVMPGEHNSAWLKTVECIEKFMPRKKEVCDSCSETALFFCLCTDPPKKYCKTCDTAHYEKTRAIEHFDIPISAYGSIVRSKEMTIDDFKKKQKYVSEILQQELVKCLSDLNKTRMSLEDEFNRFIKHCVTKRDEYLGQVDELHNQLSHLIEEAAKVIEAKRYEVYDDEAETLLEKLVLNGYLTSSRPDINLISWNIDIEPLFQQIDHCASFVINDDLVTRKRISGVPVVKEDHVSLINVQSGEITEKVLPQKTNINKASVYCFLTPTTLFCCGGDNSSETYEINLNSLQVKNLGNMSVARSYPGICYHAGFVYIFGGEGLATCEKYSLDRKTWSLLPNAMNEPKQACMSCARSNKIYVTGKCTSGGSSVEVFDVSTEQFRLIYTYPSGECWPLAVIQRDELILVVQSKVVRSKLGAKDFQEFTIDTGAVDNGYYWSNCPAVVFEKEFYSVQNNATAPRSVVKFSPARNQLTQVKALNY